MSRLPDWPERLAAYLERHRATPFAWGAHDCGRFAAGAVQAVTGTPLPLYAWACKSGAAAVLRSRGGIVAAVDALLPRLPSPALARRGDVVLLRHGHRRWLAVADGALAWGPGASGLMPAPMAQAVVAWGAG